MVSPIVVVVVVAKVLVWAEAIISKVEVVEALVIGVLTDVEIIVVAAIVIVLKFALTESCSVYVPSDVRVFIVSSADVMTALEFAVSTPLEECSR